MSQFEPAVVGGDVHFFVERQIEGFARRGINQALLASSTLQKTSVQTIFVEGHKKSTQKEAMNGSQQPCLFEGPLPREGERGRS